MTERSRSLAEVLGNGAKAIVDDLKAQVEAGEFSDPDRINRLRPSPAVLNRLRSAVNRELTVAYATGKDGALRGIERTVHAQDSLVKTFAEMDLTTLTPTMRSRYERLREKLRRAGIRTP